MEKSRAIKKMENLVIYAGALYTVLVRTRVVVTLKSVRDASLIINCAPNSPLLRPYEQEAES